MKTRPPVLLCVLLLLLGPVASWAAAGATAMPLIDAQRLGTHFEDFPDGTRWEGARLEWSPVTGRAVALSVPAGGDAPLTLPVWHETSHDPVDPRTIPGVPFDPTRAELRDHVVRLDHGGTTRWLLVRTIRATTAGAVRSHAPGMAVLIAVSRSAREAERSRTALLRFAQAPERIDGFDRDATRPPATPDRDRTGRLRSDVSCLDCSLRYERDLTACDRAYYRDVAIATAIAAGSAALCFPTTGPAVIGCDAIVLANLANEIRQAASAFRLCRSRARDRKQICLLQCDSGLKGLL